MSRIWRIACLACCGFLGLTIALAVATLRSTTAPQDFRAQVSDIFRGFESWAALPLEVESSPETVAASTSTAAKTSLANSVKPAASSVAVSNKPRAQPVITAQSLEAVVNTAAVNKPAVAVAPERRVSNGATSKVANIEPAIAATFRATPAPVLDYPPAVQAVAERRANDAHVMSATLRPAAPLPRIAQQVTSTKAHDEQDVGPPALPLTKRGPSQVELSKSADVADSLAKVAQAIAKPVFQPPTNSVAGQPLAVVPNMSQALKILESITPEKRALIEERIKGLSPEKAMDEVRSLIEPDVKAQLTKPAADTQPPTPAVLEPGSNAAATVKAEPLPAPKLDARTKASVTHMPGFDTGDDHLVLNIYDTDLRQVLELLAEQGGLNILAGPTVEGKVSCSLRDVDVETALDAILKSTGFVSRREGKLIFVGTPEEFVRVRTNLDRIGTRVYRLNYTTAKEMQNILTSMVTPAIGKVTVTSASQVGIAVDNSSSGGDNFASGEAILVQDYEGVLHQIDQIVREIDRKPMQVAIEAVIVDVTLSDENRWGVDFQFLRDQQTVRFGSGTPRTSALNGSGQPDGTGGIVGEYKLTQGGLQFAFLDSSLGAFLTAVESLGDVNVVAHPRLLCMNKQRAEILIGQQIGYVTTNVTQTFSTQTVQFLDVGTQLRLRPFISNDGMIRMEVHPEISGGSVSATGVPSKNVTQVTTNIMCPDGATVVLGGLMQETLDTSTTQIPVIGSLPVIGPLFRHKNEKISRREILVLLTPCIINDEAAAKEGATRLAAAELGQEVAKDEGIVLSRTYQSRHLVRRAQGALAEGRHPYALRLAQLAVHFNPNNRDAVQLVESLSNGELSRTIGQGTVIEPGPPQPTGSLPPAGALDGEVLSPWVLDALQNSQNMQMPPPYPRDPGLSPYIRRIETSEAVKRD